MTIYYAPGDFPGETDWSEILAVMQQDGEEYRMELVREDYEVYAYCHNGGVNQGQLIDARLEALTARPRIRGNKVTVVLSHREVLTLLRRLYEVWEADLPLSERCWDFRAAILGSLGLEEV